MPPPRAAAAARRLPPWSWASPAAHERASRWRTRCVALRRVATLRPGAPLRWVNSTCSCPCLLHLRLLRGCRPPLCARAGAGRHRAFPCLACFFSIVLFTHAAPALRACVRRCRLSLEALPPLRHAARGGPGSCGVGLPSTPRSISRARARLVHGVARARPGRGASALAAAARPPTARRHFFGVGGVEGMLARARVGACAQALAGERGRQRSLVR